MNRGLRVGVDARTFLDAAPRGEGRAGVRLYQELTRQHPEWQVTLYGERRGAAAPAGLTAARVRSFETPGFRWNTWMRAGLPAAALLDGVEVLHCTSSEAPPWAPCPLVVTVHDLIPMFFDDGASARAVTHFRRGIEHAVRRAAAIIAVSDSTRSDLVRVAGADPARVHVVYWGADAPSSAPAPQAVAQTRAELGLTRDFLLAFGGAAPRKNLAGTLSGFARIARERSDLDLAVVGMGRGAHREAAAAQIEALGLGGRVHLLRYVSEPQLETLFAGARALLYLSLYEGFGLPVLEAMSRGLPVVASNRSSIPEVAGDAALLLDPEDEAAWAGGVLELLADPDRLNHLVRRGALRASDFNWSRTAAQTGDILRRAAQA